MVDYITIIGGGLAGCEAAYQIAKRGIKVKLYEMKPAKFSPAHSNENLAEIVCSNSFKSDLLTNACGLLKEELRMMDSLLIKIADQTKVPAGQALAVDREEFAKKVTEEIKNNPLIEVINQEITSKERFGDASQILQNESLRFGDTSPILQNKTADLPKTPVPNGTNGRNLPKTSVPNGRCLEELIGEGIVIIATGPLTSDALSEGIRNLTGEEDLHFYDAQAPIVEKDSIDFNIAFYGNRYEQEKKKDETIEQWKERLTNQSEETQSYINLLMNEEEYNKFYNELINAEVVTLRDFEKREIFEGCMPVEIMAKRGIDTLRFGPLKPVGFDDPRTGRRPYAVVQLRQDNSQGSLYNIVGFQTNLKFGEQKRVFSMIPGLESANFVKYGVMHRNTFINSTRLLDNTYNFKENKNIYFAGQITGVEGYVESIASGLVSGINAVRSYKEEEKIIFDEQTMLGALAKYISTPNDKFQPMNANNGILPPLKEKIRDKKLRYKTLSERSLKIIHGMLYVVDK